MDKSAVSKWCETGTLPESEEFYKAFLTVENLFDSAEGQYWDFKENWPFSLSDDYFAAIARLVAAFGNCQGGIIVFGVHDRKRTGGHNSVKINMDRFATALNQALSSPPEIELKAYSNQQIGSVDVLLVKQRKTGVSPYRFKKQLGKYREGIIWVRVDHEVKAIEPPQYPAVFCRSNSAGIGETQQLDGSLPPSPATLKQRFVGRTAVLDQLFSWLETSDEPRMYLYGKGGSGKTTIAYEFARLIKEYGQRLIIFGGDTLETVVFVSAKEKFLDVAEAKITPTQGVDFQSERQLLEAILYHGGWSRDETFLKNASTEDLRKEIKDFFDINSILLIVDDIDTLTTKGIDSGSDFIYRLLCRASRQSKVVYTLRNVPSLSLLNAIEVPGLDDHDYEQFVEQCALHFNVPVPPEEFCERQLSEVSERRPLVIESVIALRRTAGSYDRAIELFQQHTGDAIRDYVFQREWDSMEAGTPRQLLAILSEFDHPASFRDIQSILQKEPSAINDAISAVREMFLTIHNAGNETMYSLATLTKAFVRSRRNQLVGYNVLRERVKAFSRHAAISNPRVATIATQVERLLPTRYPEHRPDKVAEANRIVEDKNLPPYVTEDPFFRTILGYVLCCKPTVQLNAIREAFSYAFDMKFEPDYAYLRVWFNVERRTGVLDGWCLKIADFVLDGKRYQEREKSEMLSRKATNLYTRGQERLHTDSVDALKDLKEALRLHLKIFRLNRDMDDPRAEVSKEYARNTAYYLSNTLVKSPVPWEFLEMLAGVAEARDIYLDPLESPIIDAAKLYSRTLIRLDAIARTRGNIRNLLSKIADEKMWLDPNTYSRVRQSLKDSDAALERQQSALRHQATRSRS